MKKHSEYDPRSSGYIGKGFLPGIPPEIPMYNGLCLQNKKLFPKGHPEYPFYLECYIGLGVINSDEDLEDALRRNEIEASRRHKARV